VFSISILDCRHPLNGKNHYLVVPIGFEPMTPWM
jgi:hypothetical protein